VAVQLAASQEGLSSMELVVGCTEHHGVVTATPASYLRDRWFNSHPRDTIPEILGYQGSAYSDYKF
jgi:hypothetical protein